MCKTTYTYLIENIAREEYVERKETSNTAPIRVIVPAGFSCANKTQQRSKI